MTRRESSQKYIKARRAAGLCTRCGIKKHNDIYWHCESCRQKAINYLNNKKKEEREQKMGQEEIYKYLTEKKGWVSTEELIIKLKSSRSAININLARLRKHKEIISKRDVNYHSSGLHKIIESDENKS